jgi:Peptidase S24-like
VRKNQRHAKRLQPNEGVMSSSAPELGDTHAVKCELASEVLRSSGKLRLSVTGWSMLPTIWPGDTLMIERTEIGAVSEGDVVLCARDQRFAAHRVLKKNASAIMTRGDAMLQPDPPVPNCDLLGKVAFIVRNGKCIRPNKSLTLSERAVAKIIQRSHIAARVIVRGYQMLERSQVQNSPDRVVRYQSEPCQS